MKDKESKTPDTQKHAEIMERTRELGLLFSKGGIYGNLLRLQPPLNITKEDAIYLTDVLEEVLTS